jgi:hypothetical protein
MKSSKRLATLSLIIMALVSTPRAVQQLRHSINAAQERAGLVWWNLLLTPEAQAAENMDAPLNPCPRPQLIAANKTTPATNPAPALKSNAGPAAAKLRLDARTAQRRDSSDSPAGSELASNNYSTPSELDSIQTPGEMPRETPQKLASHAAPQASPIWTSAKIQSALASLNPHDAPIAPPDIHIADDMYANEFVASPSMSALMTTLAKKGFNVQLRMKKALDRNQFPRPKARPLISKDADALPRPRATACECPVGL